MEGRINDVYEVFKDYYGEDRVDLQNTDILVHFPRVTVTNEHDESVEVTDLYIKTPVLLNGKMNGVFTMTRGSYLMSHAYCDYMHSHAYEIPRESYGFSRCCTGTGPIVRTMALLAEDADLDRWRLYCFELDKYTQVESETGVPYHHLNRISRSNFETQDLALQYNKVSTYGFNPNKEILKNFIPYLISKQVLKFSRHGDHYFIAHPFLEYLSILTTTFMEYDGSNNVNYYLGKNFLIKGTFENGIFKNRVPRSRCYVYNPSGNIACRFKGEEVVVTVENDLIHADDSRDLIIDPRIANYLLYKILATLNYGNARRQKPNSSTEEKRTIIL
jgi:hypothetical protein